MAAREFLDNKFGIIYASIFVNKLFREEDRYITRKNMLKRTMGGTLRKPKCDWIFDTSVIRSNFRRQFDQDMELESNCG